MTPPSPSPTTQVTNSTITDRNLEMTDTTTENIPDDTLTDQPTEITEEPDTEPNTEQEPESSSREAAKYRKQLRTVETERDQLRTDLDNMRRVEIGRQAEAAGIKPAALWASGATLENLLGEDGTPDNARILEAVDTARTMFGINRTPVAPSSHGQGKVGVPIPFTPQGGPWAGAFKPKSE